MGALTASVGAARYSELVLLSWLSWLVWFAHVVVVFFCFEVIDVAIVLVKVVVNFIFLR